MKKCLQLLMVPAVVAMFVFSCQKQASISEIEENNAGDGTTTGMTVSLNNYGTKATGTVVRSTEMEIQNFTVLVFQSGTLEAKKSFTILDQNDQSQFTGEINNLMPGEKQVVVLGNVPTGFNVPDGTLYTDLQKLCFDLSTQQTYNQLAMSGEATKTLTDNPATNNVSVELVRIVSKVKLGKIELTPEDGQEVDNFTIDSVFIMVARDSATFCVPTTKVGTKFYGGTRGTISGTTPKDYLGEAINGIGASYTDTCYFYLFPNGGTDGETTLLTIKATYEGNPLYYPIRINPDNGYIGRNKYITMNVNIVKPKFGRDDPESLADPTTMEVTITVKDWEDVPSQDIDW